MTRDVGRRDQEKRRTPTGLGVGLCLTPRPADIRTVRLRHPDGPATDRRSSDLPGFRKHDAPPRRVPGGASGLQWAWVELNYRPHAYQACALTT